MAILGHRRSTTVTPEIPSDLGECAANCTDVIHGLRVRLPPRPLRVNYFWVSQKMRSISAIWARRSSATATSLVFLASPAVLVARQKMS